MSFYWYTSNRFDNTAGDNSEHYFTALNVSFQSRFSLLVAILFLLLIFIIIVNCKNVKFKKILTPKSMRHCSFCYESETNMVLWIYSCESGPRKRHGQILKAVNRNQAYWFYIAPGFVNCKHNIALKMTVTAGQKFTLSLEYFFPIRWWAVHQNWPLTPNDLEDLAENGLWIHQIKNIIEIFSVEILHWSIVDFKGFWVNPNHSNVRVRSHLYGSLVKFKLAEIRTKPNDTLIH